MAKYTVQEEILKKSEVNSNKKDLAKVADLIENAMNIFEKHGMHEQNDQLIKFLNKLAKKKTSDFLSEFDSVYDDEGVDELLASDIEDKKNKDTDIQTDFEDE